MARTVKVYKVRLLVKQSDGTLYVSPGWRIHSVLDPRGDGEGKNILVLLEEVE